MAITRRFTKPVVPHEELDRTVTDLLAYAREHGLRTRHEAGRSEVPRRTPDVGELIRNDLRSVLEDEIVTTVEARSGSIDQTELDHELSKKALVGLKASQLKEAAKDFGIAARGGSEDLAEAIAKYYEWDEKEIAAFILRNQDEPNEAASHLTRVFFLSGLDQHATNVSEACNAVVGRYIRTDIAKWFVFNSIEAVGPHTINIDGNYMAYSVNVDELGGSPSLSPTPSAKPVKATLDIGDLSYIRVHNAPIQAARTAARAVAAICEAGLLGYVPHTTSIGRPAHNELHQASEFFLDLVYNRLLALGAERINLTVIRFHMTKDDAIGDDTKPSLKAIRFEGNHLLDSVAACRLIAKDGRPVANISMRLSYKGDTRTAEVFPMSLSLESDHFTVTTGIGMGGSTLSVDLHEKAVRTVLDEVTSGSSNPEKLERLVSKIHDRAEASADPDSANMLDGES